MPTFGPPFVYSKRLSRLKNVTNSFSDPVPVGKRWVVKCFNVCYAGDLGTNISVFFDDLEVLSQSFINLPTSQAFLVVNGFWVLNEGENMHVISSILGQGVDFTASGYELSTV